MLGILQICFIIVLLFYGLFYATTEIFCSYVPYGILCAICLYFIVHVVRVPAPQICKLEEIVGKDLCWENEDSDNNDFLLKTVAHRGAGLDAPENSLEAFNMCAEKGCKAIEFDVSLTADGVPIVFHDSTLERMTNSEKRISRHIWENLAGYDISLKHPLKDKFQNTSIPTLDQTISLLLHNKQRMFIDLKNNNVKMVKVVLDLFNKYPDLYANAVVSSFFPNLIYLVRKENPNIVCSLAWRPHIFANESYSSVTGRGPRRGKNVAMHWLLCFLDVIHEWLLPRITYYLIGVSVVLLHKDAISGRTVSEWHKKGIRVIAWTVNTPTEKQYFTKVLKITYLTDTLIGENTVHTK